MSALTVKRHAIHCAFKSCRTGVITSCDARTISLRKQSRPIISENIAVIKVNKTKLVKCTPTATPMNTDAIDKATHSPAKMNRPTDHRIHRVLLTMISNSSRNACRCSGFKAFKVLARSMDLPNRLTSTERIEPIPVSKKTGATASRIAKETWISDGVLSIFYRAFQRKSSVNGVSLLGSSGGRSTALSPGVWPWSQKRLTRRPSAS